MSSDEILFNAVCDAWRASLPHGEFAIDRTLADSGVDSLKAMELVLRIERALSCKIPYALLTAETTPRSLALELSRGAVTALTVGKPPLFFMTGIGGHSLHIVGSWQAVLDGMELILVDAPGLDRPRAVLADLRATATEVAAEIVRRQPDGDIRLMGYSYGAALAYEVAQQVQSQGRSVSFLGLIDLLPVRGIVSRLLHALRSPRILRRKLAARLPRIDRASQDRSTQTLFVQAAIRFDLRGVASKLARSKAEREGLDTAIADRLEIHHWRAQALRNWLPAPIDVPALLIASDDGVLAGSPNYWRNRIAGLKVLHVPGSHDRVATDPSNIDMARPLREALRLGP